MRTYRQIWSGFAIPVGAVILAFQILGSTSVYADHDVEHVVQNLKGGLGALEQRVWDNDQRLLDCENGIDACTGIIGDTGPTGADGATGATGATG